MTDRETTLERLRSANPLPDRDHIDAEELGLFVSYFEERKAAMHPTPTTKPIKPVRSPPRAWYRRPSLVFAAAVVVTTLVVTPLLLLRSTEPVAVTEETIAPTTTTPIAVTTIPTTPPAPAPSTTLPPPSVERVGMDVTDTFVGISDMAATDTALFAVGFNPGDDNRQDGVIVTSSDGVTWTRLAADDDALTTGTVLIYGITQTDAGLVAGGMSCDDAEFPCATGPYPTIWTSTDGTAWTRSFSDSEVIGAIEDIAVTGDGIVAAGWVNRQIEVAANPDAASTSPAVWLSTPDSDWVRVWEGQPAETVGFPPGANRILSLTVGRDGFIVAAGSALNDDGVEVAAVWVSADAHDWERTEPNSQAFGSNTGRDVSMIDIASSPSGYVAVGNEAAAEIAIWQSPDGRSWSRVDTANQPNATTGVLSAVTAFGNGWAAAGFGPGFLEGPVTTWISLDGTTWNRTTTLDTGYAQAIATINNHLTVAGGMLEDDDVHAAIWTGQPTYPAPTS